MSVFSQEEKMKKKDMISVHRVRGKSLTGVFVDIHSDPYNNYRTYLAFYCDEYKGRKIEVPLDNVSAIEVLGRM
jgi:hypothetical protein